MKKILLIMVIITIGAGFAFAEFELEIGVYGGLGNAAAAGVGFQFGYITPAYKVAGGDDPNNFRWALLGDFGFGYRYGTKKMTDETYTYSPNPGETITTTGYKMEPLDYNMGLLTEFYFLPFMGIGVGGGVAQGLNKSNFTPYARATLPFLFNSVKIGLGFDYIFWKDDIPHGVSVPAGYRLNLFINIRGEKVGNLLGSLGW